MLFSFCDGGEEFDVGVLVFGTMVTISSQEEVGSEGEEVVSCGQEGDSLGDSVFGTDDFEVAEANSSALASLECVGVSLVANLVVGGKWRRFCEFEDEGDCRRRATVGIGGERENHGAVFGGHCDLSLVDFGDFEEGAESFEGLDCS